MDYPMLVAQLHNLHNRHSESDNSSLDVVARVTIRSKNLPIAELHDEVSHVELVVAKLTIHGVAVLDVLLGHASEDRDRCLLFDSLSPRTALAMVVCVGEARFDILAGHGDGGSATVSHGRSRDRGGGEGLGRDGGRGVLAFHIIMRKP
ncbi:hypothetical protein LR48_Vigan06g087100 [Vigna angularis]|uniref:Uncharacterized protein n=1 Tax=Phaseolus angularis TaxID=3914 RepID=A0A0L9URS0_PHAAN|nr:hypothetical protein LR48_Vigan06g087100 [Vigna angularis]